MDKTLNVPTHIRNKLAYFRQEDFLTGISNLGYWKTRATPSNSEVAFHCKQYLFSFRVSTSLPVSSSSIYYEHATF